MTIFVPARRYGTELLDTPDADPALAVRTITDIALSNKIFQGTRAAVRAVSPFFSLLAPESTLLDVGTGMGDVPRQVQKAAAVAGVSLRTIGMDNESALLKRARENVSHAVCGTALALPFADGSIDIVLCSQTLHHFRDEEALNLLREMTRVARVAVVLSDLRRSWFAAAGFWAASFALRFHDVTRHDGVVSVMRGFTQEEMADTVFEAIGVRPIVHRRLGFRVTASWKPTPA